MTLFKSEKQSPLTTDNPIQEQKLVGNMKAGHDAQQIPPQCPNYVQLVLVFPGDYKNLCILPHQMPSRALNH